LFHGASLGREIVARTGVSGAAKFSEESARRREKDRTDRTDGVRA
jgi:hypothetical protein